MRNGKRICQNPSILQTNFPMILLWFVLLMPLHCFIEITGSQMSENDTLTSYGAVVRLLLLPVYCTHIEAHIDVDMREATQCVHKLRSVKILKYLRVSLFKILSHLMLCVVSNQLCIYKYIRIYLHLNMKYFDIFVTDSLFYQMQIQIPAYLCADVCMCACFWCFRWIFKYVRNSPCMLV